MRKSLGSKRNYIPEDGITRITEIYTSFDPGPHCRIFRNEELGYTKVTVERPLLDEKGKIVTDRQKKPKPDTSLRDYEKIPLSEDIDEYFRQEVLPHVPDAWMDRSNDKVGYEINFTKYFYEYKPLRALEEIKKDILDLEEETEGILSDLLEDWQVYQSESRGRRMG